MIGYVVANGKYGGDPTKTALRSNGVIQMFRSKRSAQKFISSLEVIGGLETKDLWIHKVSIKPIYGDDLL